MPENFANSTSRENAYFRKDGNPSQFVIKVGSFHDMHNDPPYERDIGVKRIWIHPKYNSQMDYNDIAILRLAKDVPFPFNNHTGVACLPSPGYQVPPGTNCVITGWGTTLGKYEHRLNFE